MPSGSVLPDGQARPAPASMTSADAARNPSWGQVLATTVRLWLSRRMPRVSIEWPDISAVAVVPFLTTANPSWGQVLVTTIRLWLSRRMPRVSIEWQHPGRPDGNQFHRPAQPDRAPAARWPAAVGPEFGPAGFVRAGAGGFDAWPRAAGRGGRDGGGGRGQPFGRGCGALAREADADPCPDPAGR